MRRKNVALGLILLGIVAMGVAWFVVTCWPAKVKIRCSRDQEGRLVVELKPNWRVNALYEVDFWLEGDSESLWIIEEGEVPIRHIVYGELPPGATQKHPAHNVPPKPVPNSGILYVGVEYQWDSVLPPAAAKGSCAVKLQLTEDGGPKLLGEAQLGEGLIEPENSQGLQNPSSTSGESY